MVMISDNTLLNPGCSTVYIRKMSLSLMMLDQIFNLLKKVNSPFCFLLWFDCNWQDCSKIHDRSKWWWQIGPDFFILKTPILWHWLQQSAEATLSINPSVSPTLLPYLHSTLGLVICIMPQSSHGKIYQEEASLQKWLMVSPKSYSSTNPDPISTCKPHKQLLLLSYHHKTLNSISNLFFFCSTYWAD